MLPVDIVSSFRLGSALVTGREGMLSEHAHPEIKQRDTDWRETRGV